MQANSFHQEGRREGRSDQWRSRSFLGLVFVLALIVLAAGLRPSDAKAKPECYPVYNPRTGECTNTIQEGVDRAAPGDQLLIGPGTFEESVRIRKEIHLKARGSFSSFETIRPPAGLPAINVDHPAWGTKVTVQGFQLDVSAGASAIRADRANLMVDANFIRGDGGGTAIQTYNPASTTVTNTTVMNFWNGLSADGGSVSIDDSEFDNTISAISVTRAESVDVSRNTIKNEADAGRFSTSSGVYLSNVRRPVVAGNVIDNFHIGVLLDRVPGAGVSGNSITNDMGTGGVGVYVSGSARSAIDGNYIANISTGISYVASEDAEASYNYLVSLDLGIANSPETVERYVVNAINNWWGACSGPSGEGGGTGVAVGRNVLFDPWLRMPPGATIWACPIEIEILPLQVTVTIAKYLDGQGATADSAGSFAFPMRSTWRAANLNGGQVTSGTYALSPVGYNNPNPYFATTARMDSGADYTTSEYNINRVCRMGDRFRLAGYSAGRSLDEAAGAPVSDDPPAFTGLRHSQYVIVWNETCPPAQVTVTIAKYVDGQVATAESASWFAFPMHATWRAANLNGGQVTSGSYTLSPTGFNNPHPYFATTAWMDSGADYTTSEYGVPRGCSPGQQFRLVGYSWGGTLDDAEGAGIYDDAPAFMGLRHDQYVIVWNESCPQTAQVTVTIVKFLDRQQATRESANGFAFPMVATWRADNLNGGQVSSGSYSLSPVGFNNPNPYWATTAAMDVGADYTTSETDIPNRCNGAGGYRLQGYSYGPTLNAAIGARIRPRPPLFHGLEVDQFVVVWNFSCR